MREVVFRLEAERPGHFEARAEGLPISISAPTLEELQHEAREALIEHLGAAHGTFRVRVRRCPGTAVSTIRPALVVASMSGRSQNTKPPMPFFSASLASFRTKPASRANRSILATAITAFSARAWARAAAS